MSSILTRRSATAATAKSVAATPLYRRLLFPSLPPNATPPPVLPSVSPELDVELYDFIALALRAYITPWWSKITRYDKELISHVSAVISAVLRALVARLQSIDLAPFLFRDVPTLVTQHYVDYRTVASKIGTSYAAGGSASIPQLFHQLQPHMAIDADGRIDPIYVRQTLDHILRECLPVEDYEPDTERTIIREVIVKVILVDLLPRITQPWFIHKILLDLLSTNPVKHRPSNPPDLPMSMRRGPPSFQVIVVFFLSAVQYLSGLCLLLISLYKQAVYIVRRVNTTPAVATFSSKDIYNYAPHITNLLAEVLTMRERAASHAVLSTVEMATGFFRPFLDRFFPYILYTHILVQPRITHAIKASKITLFPNGYPGPPPVEPSPEEQFLLKNQLVQRIQDSIPSPLTTILFGSTSMDNAHSPCHDTILAALEPLSSPQCNAHLVLFLLDLIIVTLFPELGVSFVDQDGKENPLPNSTAKSDSAEDQESYENLVTPPGSRPP